ncbi:MAG: excinuclease ABC subunit UvrC [Bacteroidota bacterium]
MNIPEENIDIHIRITKGNFSLKEKLEMLPTDPGVYLHKNSEGKVLYVGKAKNLRNRVRQYFQKSRPQIPRIERLISQISDIELLIADSEVEALILEANLIKKYSPRYNVLLKDDRSYPYIVITNEPFPRVFVTRRIIKDGSKYFGPYTDVTSVRSALKTIHEIFKIRSCNYYIDEEVVARKKIRVCLDYHIKKCDGPCEGLISRQKYCEMIGGVEQLLRGKINDLVATLEVEMQQHSERLEFETAGEFRDKINALRVYTEKQSVVDLERSERDVVAYAIEKDDACGVIFKIRDGKVIGRQHFYMSNVEGRDAEEILESLIERYYLEAEDIPVEILLADTIKDTDTLSKWLSEKSHQKVLIGIPSSDDQKKLIKFCQTNARYLLAELKVQKLKYEELIPKSVAALQYDLRLPKAPRRIECFDISNIQGSDTVASMVVFVDGKSRKSGYRKFKIKTVEGPNDFASMQEVIERRYQRLLEEQGNFPDLIVVDGGKGQLSGAVEVLHRLGVTGQPIIGLAKRLEEIFLPGESEPLQLPKTSSALRLLQRLRDEAHRFAITYHRQLRSRRTLQTELDLIEGIGKKRAKELLETFGSVQGVKFATREQHVEVVGEKVAQKIAEYFSVDEEVSES